MTANDKWNRLVKYVNDFKKSSFASIEDKYRNLWFDIFNEIFGFSKLGGEICTEKPIRIGSTTHYIDISLKNGFNELFIVEMKQCQFNLNNGYEKQLISYLNQNKNQVGLLICNKIYVYSYDYTKSDDEQLKLEISIEENNKDGIRLVELFSKENFDKEKIKEFIAKSYVSNVNVDKIRKELTPELLSCLAETYFAEKYSEDEIKTVLESCKIEINPTSPITQIVTQTMTNNYTPKHSNKNISNTEAFEICSKYGFVVNSGNATFASLNDSCSFYPATPNYKKMQNDWYIVLNDWKNRKLHVFYIPANSIDRKELKPRSDIPNKIDLRIRYNDSNFADVPTNYQFKKYHKTTITY